MGLDLNKLKSVQVKKEQDNTERERKLKEFEDNLTTQMNLFNEAHRQFIAAMTIIPDSALQKVLEQTIDYQNLDEYTINIFMDRPRVVYDREFRFHISNTKCRVYVDRTCLTEADFTNASFFVTRLFHNDADIKHCKFTQWLKKQDLSKFSLISDENKTYKYWTLYSDDVIKALLNRLTEFGLEITNHDVTWYDTGDKETDHTYLKIAVTIKNPLKG